MTDEAYRLLALSAATVLIAFGIGFVEPFAYERSFGSFSIKPYFGWLTLLFAIVSALYSLRKRVVIQLPGRLIVWKLAHIILGLTVLVLMYLHSGGAMGQGASLAVNLLVVGLLLTGVWGIINQGLIPRIMTESLEDPVYKSELQDDVNEMLKEISDDLDEQSPEFNRIYQRHILPAITLEHPTEGNQKALYQRYDPSSNDPTAAIQDLNAMSLGEIEDFYQMAEKVMDIVEIRRSQTYQRNMNHWLVWHVGMTAALGVALFFHVLASLYF